jgi:ribose transport system substrate-binding protein
VPPLNLDKLRRACAFIVVVFSPVLTSALGNSGESPKPLHLAVLTNGAADFWSDVNIGVNLAARQIPNISVDFRIPEDGTAATQTRIFRDLIARGIQGIAVSVVDPTNEIGLLNEGAKHALIATIDSDSPASERAFHVGGDNIGVGRTLGELIKNAIPKGGQIMLFVGTKSSQNAIDRIQGVKDAIQGSNVRLIDVRTDDLDLVRAKQNVADTLVRYPDIAGLIALWSYNGTAVVNAVKDSGRSGKVAIVAVDAEQDTLQGIKDGSVYATVYEDPFEWGRRVVATLVRQLQGGTTAFPADKQILIPTRVIDKSNVDDLIADLKKLRGH